jgi:hypothetical protein
VKLAIVFGLLLAACGGQRQVFVRSVVVQQRRLVIEKCPIEYAGDEAHVAACWTETLPLPVVEEASP